MAMERLNTEFQIQPLPIIGQYNVQRFTQFSPENSKNWYIVKEESGKRPYALYPCLGRRHINYVGVNRLIFGSEPRGIFKTIDYFYVVDGNNIFQINTGYTPMNITATTQLLSFTGKVYFTYLVVGTIVFSCFVDDRKIYIYREDTGKFVIVDDPNAPGVGSNGNPGFIASFGNRIVVSIANSSQFILSQINLGGNSFSSNTCFTNSTTPQVSALEEGIIRQMGVLNNTLYIFTDFTTGVWSNIQATISQVTGNIIFPWKKNSTYNWNYGIANSSSLDISFGRLVFLARNSDGLLQFMVSQGDQPKPISSKAISTLLQKYNNLYGSNSPFLQSNSNGFMYCYEDTIFYRMSGGAYYPDTVLDQTEIADSIEYNFDTDTWHKPIELNGQRNRIQDHVYFNHKHLVTIEGEGTVYEMSGQFYFNEERNPNQENEQAYDAYLVKPFRYEKTSPIISLPDYAEFETEYVEIDFVYGENDQDFNSSLYDPNVELFFSDDGGVSFQSADVREFSLIGVYQWRMRWYQLGPSRNRVYKLVAVSHTPIIVLGAVMNVRRISGGAN